MCFPQKHRRLFFFYFVSVLFLFFFSTSFGEGFFLRGEMELTILPFFFRSRPGVLVLINDADWELEGEEKYELQPRDEIVFVSTLHGG